MIRRRGAELVGDGAVPEPFQVAPVRDAPVLERGFQRAHAALARLLPQHVRRGLLHDQFAQIVVHREDLVETLPALVARAAAGLAALAERPDRIYNLFLLQEKNELNYFSVRMLYKGKWLTIDMDEYVPYLYDSPAFTKAVRS